MIGQSRPSVGRRISANYSLRSLAPAAAFGMLASFWGCGGGRELCVQLERSASFEYPIYVASYYLSDPALLDDIENKDLIDKFEEIKKQPGVVLADLRPAYPGGLEDSCRKEYDKSVAAVLLVANFKKSGACARYKTPIKSGQTLYIKASVLEECLEVSTKE